MQSRLHSTDFSNLGLIPITPLGAEERIANVTVSNARGDYQLTEALHFAAIEAMGKLSTERLANYYDKKERYESALTYYKLALPGLFMEYDQASPNDRESARRRRAEVLIIRIGDLDSEQALFKELPKLDFSKRSLCARQKHSPGGRKRRYPGRRQDWISLSGPGRIVLH